MTAEKKNLAQKCADQMWSEDMASRAMGMQMKKIDEGSAVICMKVTDSMTNGHRTCHGGAIFMLADSAFAFACNSQNRVAVASSCSIDFLRPVFQSDYLTATAKMLHQGKRHGLYEVMVTNQDEKIVARFTGRCSHIGKSILSAEDE